MDPHHPHPIQAPPPTSDAAAAAKQRYRETFKVTIIGSVLDLALAVAKLIVGFAAHSQSLIADGIHSLSDLGTDFIVIYAAKEANKEADEEHPYGHGRIETAATVALGAALLIIGGGIAFDAIHSLLNPDRLSAPGYLALVIAAISVLSKEAIYHYTLHVAKKLHSDMLRANAWHSRTDAASSVVVMIGVGASMLGLPAMDSIAAIIVALIIIKIAWDLTWSSISELIDTALDKDKVETLRQLILGVDGVKNLHMLRTRRMGGEALADVHIQVNPRISVSEGHQIGEAVRTELIEKVRELNDVTVHIDPEDDESNSSCQDLPLRGPLVQQLRDCWRDIDAAQYLENVALHYLNGKIHLELYLAMDKLKDMPTAQQSAEALSRACKQMPEVGEVVVHFR